MFFREKKQDKKEKAVEKVLCEKYNSYYRMAYSFVRNEPDACDIVQEGAYKAIKNSASLKNIEYASTWVYICYQGAGSGFEQDFFYTINLDTGKRMKLSDLFIEGSDYRTIISDDIKKQMRKQMDEDENVSYWLDDKEVEEWNFEEIPEDVSFYVNENNELVICFNEGDVAPMYMGTVEFVISNEVLGEIRK